MEEAVKSVVDYASALIVKRWVELIVLCVMLILWRWWMGHKLEDRIAAVEAQVRSSGLNQTFNFYAGADAHDHDRQLRNAIEAKTTQNLKETIRRLPQIPLGDGHTYARLPGGTNIVTMADGTMRLALPVELSANFEGNIAGSLPLTMEKIPASKGDKQDDR